MLCTNKIKKQIENKIKLLSDNFKKLSHKDLLNLQDKINNIYHKKVLEFYQEGNEIKRKIDIPYELIQEYNNTYYSPKMITNPEPLHLKYHAFLNNQINNVEKELKHLYSLRYRFSTNKEYVKKITKRINLLYKLLNNENGLKQTLEVLKNITTFENLKIIIEKDVQIINDLFESNNTKDLEKLKMYLDFYSNLDIFSEIYKNEEIEHPFFPKKIFFDKSGKIKDSMKEIVDYFQQISSFAKERNIALFNKEKKLIRTNVEEDVENENEIKKLLKARKDINKLEWLFLPPSHSSRNDISIKVLEKKLLNAINKESKYAQNIENEIESIEKDLLKEIKRLFPFLKKSELYSIFLEKDKKGFFTRKIINRYRSILFQEEYKKKKEWNKKRFKIIPNIRNKILRKNNRIKLKKEIFNWYVKNFIFIDIRKIDLSDLEKEYPNLFKTGDIYKYDKEYNNFLKEMLGEKGYNEEIKKAKDKLKNYVVNFELEIEKLEGQLEEDLITKEEFDKKINYFRYNYNPFNFLKSLDNLELKQNVYDYNKEVYLNKIPRKSKVRIENNKIINTKEETNYYNEDFKKIEENETLYKFYKILRNFSKDVFYTIGNEKGFDMFSIPSYEKSFSEILQDDTLNILQKLLKAIQYLMVKLKSAFKERIESTFSYSYTDPITGKIKYNVNDNFIQSNKKQIYTLLNIKMFKIRSFIKDKTIDLKNLSSEDLIKLASIFEIEVKDFQKLFDDTSNFNIYENLRDLITDRIIRSHTLDLGKIIKTTVYNIALYKARQEVLPFAEIIKKHYYNISKPSLTKNNLYKTNEYGQIIYEGERTRANLQFESWFNRNILGNYNKKSAFGNFIKTKIGKIGNKKLDSVFKKIEKKLNNITYFDTEDDKIIREIESFISTVNIDNLSEKDLKTYNSLIKEKERLRTHFSLTAALMSLLSYLRVLGLSYNLSAAITNFAEGQISLMLNLTNFVSEDIFWDSLKIAKYSVLKNWFIPRTKKQKLESNLARTLMDNYNILQDAYNELQKATVKSKLNKFYKLNHKELVSRIEYLNQMPILIMTLKTTDIYDKYGNKGNLWEAFMEGAKEENLGKLGVRFSTPKNRYNFEINSKEDLNNIFKEDPNLEGEERKDYNKMRNITSELIKRTQGDYSTVGGNIAGDTIEGLVFLLFKRWLPMIVNTHFKNKDYNIYTNKYEKGRKRSFNSALGALHLGVASSLFFGPTAFIFGATVGAGLVATVPYFRANRVATENLGFIKSLLLHTLQLLKTTVGIPLNIITGRNLISSEIKKGKVGEWNKKVKMSYSELDYNNMISNIKEMALILLLTGILLLTKATLYDDDDKEKDRPLHNFLVNKLMQLSSQLLMYSNPTELYKNLSNLAFINFLQNVGKTIDKFINYLEGNDIILTGVNRGESAFSNQFKKTFLPVFLRSKIGFENSMKRQFNPSVFDSYFWSEEKIAKKQVQALRAKYKNQIEDLYENDKELNKEVHKKYRAKRVGESYLELLKSYKNNKN